MRIVISIVFLVGLIPAVLLILTRPKTKTPSLEVSMQDKPEQVVITSERSLPHIVEALYISSSTKVNEPPLAVLSASNTIPTHETSLISVEPGFGGGIPPAVQEYPHVKTIPLCN